MTEEKYLELKKESKEAIKKEMKTKIDRFQNFCQKFNQKLGEKENKIRKILQL